MSILVPVLVMILGAVVYVLPVKAEVKDMGRWAYIVGLVFTVAAFSGKVLSIG